MAVLDVTCYYNTGFSEGNIPSSPAVLEYADKKSFPSVWMWQSQGLAKVKIRADWPDISQVDYIKLGTAYYTVDGIAMQNGNVAELSLRQDPINTVGGITGFQILDGWAKRVHPTTDNLFQNIMDEPWSPRQELKMDAPVMMGTPEQQSYGVTLLGSTVDLNNVSYAARQYFERATDGTLNPAKPLVAVPEITSVNEETSVKIGSTSGDSNWSEFGLLTQKLPGLLIYTFDNSAIKSAVGSLRSLGLENTLTVCYQAPRYFIRPVYKTGDGDGGASPIVTQLEGVVHKVTGSQPYIYGEYKCKNNKVYSLFNQYKVVALATGDEQEFGARELYSGGTSPDFWLYADPSPNGCPYCQPTYYEGAATKPFQNCIQGAKWMSTPITFDAPSAWLSDYKSYRQAQEDMLTGMVGSLASNANPLSTLGLSQKPSMSEGISAAGGVLGTIGTLYDTSKAAKRARSAWSDYTQIKAPEIKFARSAEIQGYVGNGFMVYRLRLSEADMIAFDNFLTMYGYANSRRLTQADLSSRKCFNFVQASNVAVSGPKALWLREAISSYFENGVRLWHELPNQAAMTDNPIKGGN